MSEIRDLKGQPARTTDVVIVGAGQAGLGMSYCLAEQGIDHIVLERGEVGNSWRNERWDSLRLLTPNWMTRLPGKPYTGDDPDGFMSMQDVVDFMQSYADSSAAPVQSLTTVKSVRPDNGGYRVVTDKGNWRCRCVVIASGAFNTANIPRVAASMPAHIEQLTPHSYRNPKQLCDGAVLVVGGSATGLQLADEIRKAGHDVYLATGEHVRLPRRYRGRDILSWMSEAGVLDESYMAMDDINRARRLPSSQLVGSQEHEILDLNYLMSRGVKIGGRLMGCQNGTAQFSGSLANVCALADLKMNRLLNAIDTWIASNDIACEAPHRFAATHIDSSPLLALDLASSNVQTVLWATGFRPDYSWLEVPVLDRKGHLRHDGGVVDAPGLYALGLPVMRRRNSSFIHGVEQDVRDLLPHISAYLRGTVTPVAA